MIHSPHPSWSTHHLWSHMICHMTVKDEGAVLTTCDCPANTEQCAGHDTGPASPPRGQRLHEIIIPPLIIGLQDCNSHIHWHPDVANTQIQGKTHQPWEMSCYKLGLWHVMWHVTRAPACCQHWWQKECVSACSLVSFPCLQTSQHNCKHSRKTKPGCATPK